jgi:hypothetical protein
MTAYDTADSGDLFALLFPTAKRKEHVEWEDQGVWFIFRRTLWRNGSPRLQRQWLSFVDNCRPVF